MTRKIWLVRKTFDGDLDPARYYYSYDYELIPLTKRRPHGPMPAKRNVDNYVEKRKTSHEAKTEV